MKFIPTYDISTLKHDGYFLVHPNGRIHFISFN